MKQPFLILNIVLISLAFYNHSVITTEQISKSRFVKDHFIVKLKSEIKGTAASYKLSDYEQNIIEIGKTINVKISKTKKLFPLDIKHIEKYKAFELDTYLLVYPDKSSDILSICESFAKNNSVEFAEPDFVGEAAGEKSVPNDEFFTRQWGLYNDGTLKSTTGKQGKKGADINAVNGWDITLGSEDIIVGVMDSGVKPDHPELSDRIWINTKEVKNGRDDDGNGYVDDINGWNFAYENSNIRDDGGHGTNIAGTIGANTNNAIGYAGLDQRCKLMVCKNLDNDNLGEYSWWASSLYYASNNGAKVINMSEGGYDYSKTLKTGIDYAYSLGCVINASMMNKNNSDIYYPASFKNIIAVGATDCDDSRCRQFTWGGGSNWGKHISVVAPGNRIYGLDNKDDYNYEVYWSGTSQATAYVTGLCSLLLSQDPGRTNEQIKEIITSTAHDQVGDPREDTEGWDEYYGYGRIDVYDALTYATNSGKKNYNKDRDEGRNNKEDKNANSSKAKAVDKDKSNDDSDHRARKTEH